MNHKEDEIASLFVALMEGITSSNDNEVDEQYGKQIDAIVEAHKDLKDPEHFDLFVQYPLDNVLRVLVSKINPSENRSKIYVIYKHYDFLNSNISNLVTVREGMACSVDKSRWIIASYLKHIETGSFPDMSIDDKCYWKPEFGSAEQWMKFCDGLLALQHGRPQQYLHTLNELMMINVE